MKSRLKSVLALAFAAVYSAAAFGAPRVTETITSSTIVKDIAMSQFDEAYDTGIEVNADNWEVIELDANKNVATADDSGENYAIKPGTLDGDSQIILKWLGAEKKNTNRVFNVNVATIRSMEKKVKNFDDAGKTATVEIVTHYAKKRSPSTTKVLFLGTACTSHTKNMKEALTNAVNGVASKSSVDYHIYYDKSENGDWDVVTGSVAQGSRMSAVQVNALTETTGTDIVLGNGHHAAMEQFYQVLSNYVANIETTDLYDYIVFEFDGSLLGTASKNNQGGSTYGSGHSKYVYNAARETMVATVLQRYYDLGRVCWIVNQWDKDADQQADPNVDYFVPAKYSKGLLGDNNWKGLQGLLNPDYYLKGINGVRQVTVDRYLADGKTDKPDYGEQCWVGHGITRGIANEYEGSEEPAHWTTYMNAAEIGDVLSKMLHTRAIDAVVTDFINTNLQVKAHRFYQSDNGEDWKEESLLGGSTLEKGYDEAQNCVTGVIHGLSADWWTKLEIDVKDENGKFLVPDEAKYWVKRDGDAYSYDPNDTAAHDGSCGPALALEYDAETGKELTDTNAWTEVLWQRHLGTLTVTAEGVNKVYDGETANVTVSVTDNTKYDKESATLSAYFSYDEKETWTGPFNFGQAEKPYKDVTNLWVKIVASKDWYVPATSEVVQVLFKKRPVTIKSGDEKGHVYDGIAATNWTAAVTEDSPYGFVTCESVTYKYTGSRTVVGTADNTFEVDQYTGGAKADNYDLTLKPGELEVVKAPIKPVNPGKEPPESGAYTLAPDIVRIYDGTGSNIVPDTFYLVDKAGIDAPTYTYSLSENGAYVPWDELQLKNVELNDDGSYKAQKVWYTVETKAPANYFSAKNFAYVTITQRLVTVEALAASKKFGKDDPTPWKWDLDQTATDIVDCEESDVRGALTDVVSLARCSQTGSFDPQALEQAVGNYESVITTNKPFGVQADLPLGNYRLAFKPGDFEITGGKFAIQANGVNKTYDGKRVNATVSVTVDSAPATTADLTTLAVSYGASSTGPWTEAAYDPKAFVNVTNLYARFVATKEGYVTDAGYLAATSVAQVVISPLAITVTAKDYSRKPGEANPTDEKIKAECTISPALLSGDTIVFTATCTYKGEEIGTHSKVIVPSGAAVQGNYSVTYVPGNLTITERPKLKIFVADTSVVYGADVPTNSLALRPTATRYEPANPDETKINGLNTVKFMTTYTKWSPVGQYVINTNSADITSTYYDIEVVPGKLTVTPETIETIPPGEEPEPPASGRPWVWAPDILKCYDGLGTNTTAHVYGLHEGNEPTFLYSTNATGPWVAWKNLQFTDVSTNKVWYSVTTKDAANIANYFAATNYAWVTITQRWITVTAQDYVRKPGEPNPTDKQIKDECELSEPLIPGNVIEWEAKCTYQGEEIGTHEGVMVPYGEESQGNYRVAYEPGDLTITDKTPLKIFVADKTVTYGDPVPTDLGFRPVATRYECAEKVDRSKIFGEDTVTFMTDYKQGSPAGGKYVINTNSADVTSVYYLITVVPGKLTVVPEKIDTPPPGDVPPTGTDPWTWAPNIVRCYDGEGTNINPVTENLLPGNVPSYLYSLEKDGTFVEWDELQLTNVVFDAKGGVTSNKVWYSVRTTPANYFSATNFAWVTITQRLVTVEAADASKVYGNADPKPFGWDLVDAEGTVVPGEIPAVREALTAEINRVGLGRFNEAGGLPAEENVGAYADVISTNAPFAAYTKGVLANYRVAFLRGDFAISPAQIIDDPTESAKPWAWASDVIVWTNDCPEVTSVGTNIVVKTGLWTAEDDKKVVLRYSTVDPAVAQPSDWSDKLSFTEICNTQVWCSVSCENYLPTNVSAYVVILSKAVDVVDEGAEEEDKPLPNPQTEEAVNKVLDGIVENSEVLVTGDPNPAYDPNRPGWEAGQLDGRVYLAFTSIKNIPDEAERRAAQAHLEETAENYLSANPNTRNFVARSVDVKLAYSQAFRDASKSKASLIGDTNTEPIPFTLAIDLSQNRQVLQVTRYHRGEVRPFESGEGYAVKRNAADPSASTITITAKRYSEFIILLGEPYTPPQPTPPGGCTPAEPEDGLVYQFRAQLYTTRGVVRAGKSTGSVCNPGESTCLVLRGKDKTQIDGWIYACSRVCSGLRDASAVLWDSYRKAKVADAAFDTAVLNIMGARNAEAEWAWTLTGTSVYDASRQQSIELRGAGYGTFSTSAGLYKSFSGYVAGTADAPYDLTTKLSSAVSSCICEPSQILTCESYGDLEFESQPTVMFGRWKMKYNAAASKAYGERGYIKVPSYVKLSD